MNEAQRVLVRGAAVTGHFLVETRTPGPGWVPYLTAVTPEGLERLLGYVRQAVPGASDTVAAALFASSVCGALAAPLTGALLTERRVAIPDPAGLWLRPSFTGVDAIAVGGVGLTVLGDDPLAAAPGALGGAGALEVATVASLDELRRAALEGYRGVLVPLLDAVAASTRRGRRALWADAGDRLATYLLLAGRALGNDRAGRDEADALLALAEPPLRHEPAWLEFEHRGRLVHWKRRPVCCLVYQAPTFAGQYCATCPLVPESETVERTRAWLG
ncbi:MAG: hypothetical protein ACRDT6_00955 [Micromonosporaceae bacterium]